MSHDDALRSIVQRMNTVYRNSLNTVSCNELVLWSDVDSEKLRWASGERSSNGSKENTNLVLRNG